MIMKLCEPWKRFDDYSIFGEVLRLRYVLGLNQTYTKKHIVVQRGCAHLYKKCRLVL